MLPAPVSPRGAQEVMGAGGREVVSLASLPPPHSSVSLVFKKEELTHLAVFSMALLKVKD